MYYISLEKSQRYLAAVMKPGCCSLILASRWEDPIWVQKREKGLIILILSTELHMKYASML